MVIKSLVNLLFIVSTFLNIRSVNYIKAIYKENKSSFWFLATIWCTASISLISQSKSFLVLLFNQHRTNELNVLFGGFTQLAEGVSCVIICLIVLYIDWKKGLFLSFCISVNSLIVQFLKRFIFENHKRPVFDLANVLTPIPGQEFYREHSFPSGHTMAAFTLFFVLSLFVSKPIYKLMLLLLASLVALSRVYLAQHYLEDILAASMLAILLCVVYYSYYFKKIIRS
jgi:membrane-associated phospholipid phosphatase